MDTVGTPAQLTALTQALAAGDHAAFTELYTLLRPRLIGLATTVLHDYYLAEDVVHEVFAYLWAHPDRFDPARGHALSWLMTITHRRAIDRYRHETAQHTLTTTAISLVQRPHPSPDETVIAAEERREVAARVGHLTDLQHAAVHAIYYRHRTQPEAATAAGIALPTFKSRIQGALHRLRTLTPAA